MGIKWNDIKLGVSPLSNNIYIGKVKRDTKGLLIFSDKSGDMTKQCVKAVMEHMLQQCDEENNQITFTIEGKCELILRKLD